MLASKQYKSIFEALPTASLILEPQKDCYKIVAANKQYLEITHSNKDQVIGQPFLDKHLPDIFEQAEEITQDIRNSLANIQQLNSNNERKVWRSSLITDSDNGERFWQFNNTPIFNDDGDLSLILHTLQDITTKLTAEEKSEKNKANRITSRSQLHTQNKVLEDQIAKKISQYEAASQELNDFIYSVSHDLRAPLRRIDGFSQELINEHLDQLDDSGAHYLKRVRQGAQDMGNLIDDLLKLSRISRREILIEPIDIGVIAESVYNELLDLEKDRNIHISIEENLSTEADHGLVKAMLMNLLSNALKFTAKEEQANIKIGETTVNEQSYFYIKDNGVGFDPTYSEKLFKAFDRLHSQKEFQGSGIGLATVKRIVNLHGGTIWAESKPGEGATFYFNFQGPK